MGTEQSVQLIAHRGGIVDEGHPENSFASLAAAVHGDYWMVEVDVRRTRDGVFVIWHDAEMELNGRVVTIEDTPWDQIRSNTVHESEYDLGDGGGQSVQSRRPPTLEEVLERYAGQIRFMLDIKNRNHPPEVYPQLEKLLEEFNQVKPTYFIGAPDGKKFFRGRAWTAGTFTSLAGEEWKQAADTRQFLFESGSVLTTDIFNHAQEFDVPVVASVNLGHYAGLTKIKDPDLTAPQEDIARLLQAGVRKFQIDSVFEPFIEEAR